jgi:hypothetical protein
MHSRYCVVPFTIPSDWLVERSPADGYPTLRWTLNLYLPKISIGLRRLPLIGWSKTGLVGVQFFVFRTKSIIAENVPPGGKQGLAVGAGGRFCTDDGESGIPLVRKSLVNRFVCIYWLLIVARWLFKQPKKKIRHVTCVLGNDMIWSCPHNLSDLIVHIVHTVLYEIQIWIIVSFSIP